MSEPEVKKQTMSSLSYLKNFTTVVADTGDFEGRLCQIYISGLITYHLYSILAVIYSKYFYEF